MGTEKQRHERSTASGITMKLSPFFRLNTYDPLS